MEVLEIRKNESPTLPSVPNNQTVIPSASEESPPLTTNNQIPVIMTTSE
jgi:hypothetical protein